MSTMPPNLLDFDSVDVLTFWKVVLHEQEENATHVLKILGKKDKKQQ